MAPYSAEGIRQRWPNLAWMIDNPEVGPIMRQAYEQDWDEARFQAAIASTQWWTSRSQSQRTWEALVNTDNATARRQVEGLIPTIRDTAVQMGVHPDRLDPATLWTLADAKIRYGWTEGELRANLAAMVQPGGGAPGSSYQATASFVRETAASYLMPVDEATVAHWTRELAAGRATEEGIRSFYKEQAKARHPHLASQFDQGITLKSYMSPVVGTVAQILEVAPESIDLMNPRWGVLVDYNAEGQVRPMTLTEAANYARSLPEWGRTQNARDRVDNVARGILETFGAI